MTFRTPTQRFGLAVAALAWLALSAASGTADFVPPSHAHLSRHPSATPSVAMPAVAMPSLAGIPAPAASRFPQTPANPVGAERLRDPSGVEAPASLTIAAEAVEVRHATRTVWMDVTAYCACKKCCGPSAKGVTSSGRPITYNGGHFAAADLRLYPYGTRLIIPGYNDDNAVEVIDRGGAIRGHHIDLFMPSHEQAVEWGKKRVLVTIFE